MPSASMTAAELRYTPAACRSKIGTMRTTASSRASACIASVVGPGDRLGQIEALALLRLAEVRRVEELLQADDLRARPAASRMSRFARARLAAASRSRDPG